MKVRIAYLADHPEHIDQVAYWHWSEWDREMLGLSLDEVTKLVREYSLNKDRLDINLIALNEKNECIGTIELADNEFLPGYDDHKPWLGSLYVDPAFRHKDVASRLIMAATLLAGHLNFSVLYTYTHRLDHDRMVEDGFDKLEEKDFAGHHWRIYSKTLHRNKVLSDADSPPSRIYRR